MPVSLSEAVRILLSGKDLSWPKFGSNKAGSIRLGNPDGTAPAEILSLEGELGIVRLTDLLEVVGVLFELPN